MSVIFNIQNKDAHINAEKKAIRILGNELYAKCISFFEDVFNHKSKFKMFMTRRCYALYRFLLPILENKGIKNNYGEIITDKSVCFYYNEIREALYSDDADAILVADDIIIFGRTINSILDDILEKCGLKCESDLVNRIKIRSIIRNVSNSNIKPCYERNALSKLYMTKFEWKVCSNALSELIDNANISNTSYIVSYNNKIDDFPVLQKLLPYIQKKNTNNIYRALWGANFDSTENSLKKRVVSSINRVYYYEDSKSLIVSPLVIFDCIHDVEMNDICNDICKGICNGPESLREKARNSYNLLHTEDKSLFSAKIQYLTLLCSHGVLCDFLKKKGLDCTIDSFDYKEILEYNFTRDISSEFIDVHELISSSNYFSGTYNIVNENKSSSEILFKNVFRKAMEDNQAAVRKEEERLEGFAINDETINVFEKQFMHPLVYLIDTGKATLKSFFANNQYKTLLYPGEQAFRIAVDSLDRYLYYLRYAEVCANLHNFNAFDAQKVLQETLDLFGEKINAKQKVDEAELQFYVSTLYQTNHKIEDIYMQTVSNLQCDEDIDRKLKDYIKYYIKREVKQLVSC